MITKQNSQIDALLKNVSDYKNAVNKTEYDLVQDKAKAYNTINLFKKDKSIPEISAKLGELDARTLSYLNTVDKGSASFEGFEKHQISMSQAFKETHGNLSGITTALKSFGKNLLSIGINMVAMIAVVKGIELAFGFFDSLVDTQSELKEAAANNAQAYEDTKSKIEEVNSTLEDNSARIDELNAKGKLSFVEQEELDKLKESNDLLEVQKNILNDEKNKKAVDSAIASMASADSIMNPSYWDNFTNIDWGNAIFGGNTDQTSIETSSIDELLEKYNKYSEAQKEAVKNGKTLATQDVDNFSLVSNTIQDNLSTLLEYQQNAKDGYKLLSEKDITTLSSNEKEAIETYKKTSEIIDQIQKTLNPGKFKSNKISEIFETKDIEVTKEKLIELAKAGKLEDLDLRNYFNLSEAMVDAGISANDLKSEISSLAENEASGLTDHTERVQSLESAILNADEAIESFNKALSESGSAKGMSSKSIDAVIKMFQGLEGYDYSTLFEQTANGIHLNDTALRQLTKQYEATQKLSYAQELKNLMDNYDAVSVSIKNCTDEEKKRDLVAQQSTLSDQIETVSRLATQYDGLTSAYEKWNTAQSATEDGDTYDSLVKSLEDIKKLYDDGLVGTDKFRTATQLMSNQDLSTASVDELIKAYESGIPKIERYFKEGIDGTQNFLKDIQNLNKEWAHMNKDGSWEINFGTGNDQEIADKLGINVESVQQILRKLSDQGFDIQIDTASAVDNIFTLKEKVDETSNKLRDLTGDSVDIDINVEDDKVDDEITKCQEKIAEITSKEHLTEIDIANEDALKASLDFLVNRKIELAQPTFMSIDTSTLDTDLGAAVELLQTYQEKVNNLSALQITGGDTTQAQKQVDDLLAKIGKLDDNTKKTLGIDVQWDETKIQEQLASKSFDIKANIQTTGKEKVDELNNSIDAVKSKEVDVKANVYGQDSVAEMKKKIDAVKGKTVEVKVNTIETKSEASKAEGTAHASGTAMAHGTAKAKGDWGTDESGTALGGELGEEILVRNGKYYIIGSNGAEFFDYQKDDIIFNHLQSRQLLTNGNIYSRGKFAKANGTAFAEGTAFSGGSGKFKKKTTTSSKSKKKSSKSKSSKSSSSEKSFEDTFDWVDRALNLVDKVVKRLSNAVENVYRDWSDRNQKIGEEIGQLGAQMNYYQSAYSTYMNKANSIPLAENYKQMVRDGNWSIQTITDENLAKQIKEYQDWYDKAEDCQIKLEEIREEIGATYKKQFDNIAKEFENRIGELEASLTSLDNKFELSKYKETGINNDYLQQQIPLHQSKVSELTKEINALQSQLQNAVNSGLVGIYSEGYQEMVSTINDLKNDLISAQEDISKVYEEMFDNIASKYDSQIEYIDEYISQVEKYANLAESKGMLATASYYELMLAYQKENLENLELERKALAENLQSALDSQSVVVGSEKWYEFQQQINEVDSAIIDANQSIQDFMNSIRDLEWDNFDYLQDTISQITTEMDFLLDLMSNQKLFDDNGNQTEYGKAAEALHGVNYNTFMSQSDEYAKAIKELDAQYADDSLNKDYLERRQELVELQQDMILNAQDEKEAIKDLVREGYEAQLDAFKKLIDLKTQLLDKNKDLYDYEKAIIEKTQALANIQKQLGAYSGDSSEEGKKTVQELKLELQNAKDDLEETEYEKYISDQQAILDNFADEFESWFTERLDNFDATFSEIIDRINANSAEVGETIKNAADKVGYDLSDSFNTIFNSKDGEITNVISKYDENFSNRMTTLQSAIDAIKIGIDYMSAEAKAEAERKAAEQKAKEEAIKRQQEIQKQQEAERQQQQQQQQQNQQQQQQQPQPSDDRNIFVHKRDSYPKGKLDRYRSIVDALKYFDFDSSFNQRANYFGKLGGSGTYTGSSQQNQWMLSRFRGIMGYSKGGVVGNLQAIARSNGDDTFTINTLKKGEGIIPLQMMPEWKTLISTLPTLNNMIKSVGTSPIINIQGMELILPNVTDYESLRKALLDDPTFNRAVLTTASSAMTGSNSLKSKRFR